MTVTAPTGARLPAPLRAGIGSVVWGVLVVAAAVAVLLLALGWRPVVLLSDSMAPYAGAGSLVVSRPVPPHEVVVGDVLTVDPGTGRPVTHRVIAVELHDDGTWVRLQGDANPDPDLGRVQLDADVLRAVGVLPVVGHLVASGGPALVAGLLLLWVGAAGLLRVRRAQDPVDRTSTRPATEPSTVPATEPSTVPATVPAGPAPAGPTPPAPATPTPRAAPTGPAATTTPGTSDPRLVALTATLEAIVEDGLDPAVARTLARVRVGELRTGSSVERHAAAADLDDGARFVLFALIDADVAALTLVPARSARQRAAASLVDRWWDDLPSADLYPLADDVRALVEPVA